jgi:alpha-tubulin suppressor-like RCC1 family protein
MSVLLLCGFAAGRSPEDRLVPTPCTSVCVRVLLSGGFGVALALGRDAGALLLDGDAAETPELLERDDDSSLLCGCLGYDWGVLVSDTHVRGFGANTHGQALGGVVSPHLAAPTAFALPPEFLASSVRKIVGGERHALCLLQDGRVLAWGDNEDGQTPGAAHPSVPGIRVLQLPAPAVDIAAGARHSLIALSGTAGVAACGWGLYGQRGDADALAEPPSAPVTLSGLAGMECIAVAAGLAHSLCLTADGSVYSWGWNESGQLGIGPPSEAGQVHTTPQLLECDKLEPTTEGRRVVSISCGSRHSACLRSDGAMFTWGWGGHGQLGHGGRENVHSPKLALQGVSQVQCGWWHTVALID